MTLLYNIIEEPDEGSDCAKDVNDPVVNIWDRWVDPNVESVSDLLKSRMEVGFKKYGTTTERKDIDLLGWLQHLQEELLDAAVYIERLKKEVKLEHRDLESLDPANRTWEYDEEGLPRDKVTGKRVEL